MLLCYQINLKYFHQFITTFFVNFLIRFKIVQHNTGENSLFLDKLSAVCWEIVYFYMHFRGSVVDLFRNSKVNSYRTHNLFRERRFRRSITHYTIYMSCPNHNVINVSLGQRLIYLKEFIFKYIWDSIAILELQKRK